VSPERLHLRLRSQRLAIDASGHASWEVATTEKVVPVARLALILCDVWDSHWSRGARERVEILAPRIDRVVRAVRSRGGQIVHAPSETMEFYAGTPARQRARDLPRVEPPPPADHPDPPLPIDDSDGGSDTGETSWHKAWTRQHPAIGIDQERDVMSDSGVEIYSLLRQRGIEQVVIAGVHTNMCVLNRSFAIKALVRWGVPVALARDLTDSMYNPARPPYVSHADGTRLVVEYVEKFWCPTIDSADLTVG
jgi:nicotinamidase-related amidase